MEQKVDAFLNRYVWYRDLNLCNRNTVNNIYAAIGSNSYLDTMKYFLEEYGLIDIEFHLYIDNDIDNNVLPRIKQVFCDNLFYTVCT